MAVNDFSMLEELDKNNRRVIHKNARRTEVGRVTKNVHYIRTYAGSGDPSAGRGKRSPMPKGTRDTSAVLGERTEHFSMFTEMTLLPTNIRADAYFGLIDRRAAGEPLQYILGSQEFMGLNFAVNPSVLIPPPGYGTLVELALKQVGEKKRSLSILDMCCGAVRSLSRWRIFLPKAKITACDISPESAGSRPRKCGKKTV